VQREFTESTLEQSVMSPANAPKWHKLVSRASRLAAYVLLLWIAGMAVPLVVTGILWTGVSETVTVGEEPVRSEQAFYQPYPAAWGYLVSGGLIAIGLSRRKWLPVAWVGVIGLTLWSGVWLFSSGAAFLPLAGVTILLLAIISTTWPRPEQ
jgi:hypothetical protein